MHFKCVQRLAFAGGLSFFASTVARGNSPVVEWTSGPGANGAYYERIDVRSSPSFTYPDAVAAAAAMTYSANSHVYQGELAVFDQNYSDAFNFVLSNVVYPTGNAAPSNEIYWVGASSPTGNQPPNDGNNSDWTWVDGSPVPDSVASGWDIDHAEGSGAEGIGYFESSSATLWDYLETAPDDLADGYVVEFAVPEPASMGMLTLAAAALLCKRRR